MQTIRYEKISATEMRRWIFDDTVLTKGDLQNERAHYNNALSRADGEKLKVIERFNPGISLEEYNAYLQERQDELDILIELFNNSTGDETIPFLIP